MMQTWNHYYQMRPPEPSMELIKALPNVVTGRKALDIGCGSLIEGCFLLEKGFTITAIDPDPFAELYAKENKHDQLTFLPIPAEEYNYPSEHFDLVYAMRCLSYVPRKYLMGIIRSVYNSLVKKGVFVFELLEGDDRCKKIYEGRGSVYSPSEIQDLILPFEVKKLESLRTNDLGARIIDIVTIK